MGTTTAARFTIRNKVGLVMAGLLGVGDLTGPAPAALAAAVLLPQGLWAAVIGVFVATVALGIVTIVCVILAWARGSRRSARVVAAARVIDVLIAAPVFLAQLEAWLVVIAAAAVILNITAVILVLSRPVDPPLAA